MPISPPKGKALQRNFLWVCRLLENSAKLKAELERNYATPRRLAQLI
jgi:hypothetical protein